GTMGNEVEARTKRVRNHLQRPDHPDRQLTNAKVGSTVNRTAPTQHALAPWRQRFFSGGSPVYSCGSAVTASRQQLE
ncbi:hypothetical protein, partial [Mycobacterium sp.]|uniref:hypothetical protein n=1 Tax=Mycobacterium sp. TaxID=1785 RepID=UPI0026278BCB